MHRMHITTTVFTAAALAQFAVAQTRHDGDFFIGINSTGQLAVEGDFDEAAQLPAFDDGGIHGWFGDEPGFASLDENEPDEDFYMLADGANIYFELLSVDPAFKVYDPFFVQLSPGDSFELGGHEFDEHAFWHIDSQDAAFDPNQTVWNITWRVIDQGSTGYATSDVFTSQFTNVPTPGGLVPMALTSLAFTRRRR